MPKRTATEKLEHLRAEVRAAETRIGELQARRHRAGRHVASARAALASYYESLESGDRGPDAALEAKLRRERDEAETRVERTTITERGHVREVLRDPEIEAGIDAAIDRRQAAQNAVAEVLTEQREQLQQELSARAIQAGDDLLRAIPVLPGRSRASRSSGPTRSC